MLRIANLKYAYADVPVLKDISFELRQGEVLGILGPNGAGKSTMFGILTGLLPPQEGRFFLHEKEFDPLNPTNRAKWGVVFQNPSLDQKLSALENLYLSAALFRVTKSRAAPRAHDLLHLMELQDRKDDIVQKYSGGMRRKLEIARALVHDPEILVLDEPTTGLDETAYQKIWGRLLQMRREKNLSLLLTSHRADEAEKCDRLVILDHGAIIADDTPENLKKQIGGDVITLTPVPGGASAADLHKKFQIECRQINGEILVEIPNGHEWIPKIVESFPQNTFQSVNIRKPSLGDVFIKLTGRTLNQDNHVKPI